MSAEPTTHPNHDATRAMLCDLGARIVHLGLSAGNSGNISARITSPAAPAPTLVADDPLPTLRLHGRLGRTRRSSIAPVPVAAVAAPVAPAAVEPSTDRLLISPAHELLERLTPADLAEATLTGEHLRGPLPAHELVLHTAIFTKYPQANVVIHLHSPYATAASCLEPWSPSSAIPPLTPSLLMNVGRVPRALYVTPGPDLATCLDGVGGEYRAVLLANHGSLVWGVSAAAALEAAIEVEEAARLYLLLHGARAVTTLSDAEAQALAATYGTPW